MGKLIDLFKKGKPGPSEEDSLLGMLQEEVDRKAARQVQRHFQRAGRTLTGCLTIALLGTTVPIPAANTFFSITTLLLIIIAAVLRSRLQFGKAGILGIALLFAASVATGCSPTLETIDKDILAACRESTGEVCSYGTAVGYAVCGIPVRYATIDQARLDGGVDDVFGVETVRGFGLVSVTRLKVYGGKNLRKRRGSRP